MINKGISLKDQAAIVTGGGAGIGRAICIALAAHGAKVLVADMSSAGADETVEKIREMGGEAAAIQANVTKAEDAEAMVSKCEDVADIAVFLASDYAEYMTAQGVEQTREMFDESGLRPVGFRLPIELHASSVRFQHDFASLQETIRTAHAIGYPLGLT